MGEKIKKTAHTREEWGGKEGTVPYKLDWYGSLYQVLVQRVRVQVWCGDGVPVKPFFAQL